MSQINPEIHCSSPWLSYSPRPFSRTRTLDGGHGAEGDRQVVGMHHAGKAAYAVVDKVAGQVATEYLNFFTEVAHRPAFIVAAAIHRARQTADQAAEATLALLQGAGGLVQVVDVAGDAQVASDHPLGIAHGADGEVDDALLAVFAPVGPLAGFRLAQFRESSEHRKPADFTAKLAAKLLATRLDFLAQVE